MNSPQRPIPKRASALPHPRPRCAPAGLMAGEPVPSVVAGCLAPGLPLRELGQSRRTLQSAPFISGDRRAIFDLAGWAVLAQRPFRRSLLRFICHHSSMLHLSRKFNFSQAGVSLLGCDKDEPDPRERGGPAGAGGRPRGSGSSDRAHRPHWQSLQRRRRCVAGGAPAHRATRGGRARRGTGWQGRRSGTRTRRVRRALEPGLAVRISAMCRDRDGAVVARAGGRRRGRLR